MELMKKAFFEAVKIIISACLAAIGLTTSGCFHM